MTTFRPLSAILLAGLTGYASGSEATLDSGFRNPPPEAKIRAYWWWLNGNVTKESISLDLREMARKGFGGALICDAGGAEQRGNAQVPHGPTFFSPAWRELYKHTLREASRYGLEMSLNIQSGWNLGGPMVPAKDAPKKLVWSERVVDTNSGPIRLEEPKHPPALYGDVAVLAYPVRADYNPERREKLANWEQKALLRPLTSSAPDTTMLLVDRPDAPNEEATQSRQVIDLTRKMRPDGTLDWRPPAGRWEILRIGYTLNDHSRVSTHSEGWEGYALDPFDRGAFDRYWNAVVEPLIADAGPLAGTTLKYLHTDSWEVEVANWTPTLFREFRKRRGYDLRPFLPVLTGRIVDRRSASNRVLHDLRRTMGDLAIDNHYRPFRDYAHRRKLLIHPESGGPHAVPIDSLQCLGYNDAPMSEFWAGSWTHRVREEDRFFVKQPASAAHTYGRKLVLAEGFTTIGPHWQETIWDNLKPNFDRACAEGLNRLVWHAFVNSPASEGLPGQQYFAGTHFNPQVTWWEQSEPFLAYMNRCQFMLQRGQFVADALFYYGDHVPNFTQLAKSDPARLRPGYDYDVATQEVILNRLSVRNGRLVLPDGMNYRVLVLPPQDAISLPVLRKVERLVRAGATVVGSRFYRASAYEGSAAADAEVRQIVERLWGNGDPGIRRVGAGRVANVRGARELFAQDGLAPDFEGEGLNWIHRREGETDLYFVANPAKEAVRRTVKFRVAGRQPELWNPATGEVRPLTDWTTEAGQTAVPLEFDPCGSWFVVFRQPGSPASGSPNFPAFAPVATLDGAWQVGFDPKWGGPAAVTFAQLTDWTKHDDPGIRYYAGTATYATTFDAPASDGPVFLDLGEVRELAEVTLNGKPLGVVWRPPFRVDVTGLLQPKGNRLEVRVTNFWPNRIVGDAILGTKFTKTNVRQITAETALMPSGLMGPVRLLRQR